MLGGSIEYGGNCISTPRNARQGSYPDALSCGSLFVASGGALTQTPMDKAPWQALFTDLQKKSKYWYSLKPNGVFTSAKAGPGGSTMIWFAGDDECLQVFHFDRFDLVDQWTIKLDASLIGKTILINVSPFDKQGNKGPVQIQNIGSFVDPWGGSNLSFNSLTKQSMLWNFYGATKVTLGPGGGIQFPGSVLVPHGDLDMLWPGQDGRTIVFGNCLHNSAGSEFHNYEFDPPCPLPLPPDIDVPDECHTPCPSSTPTTVPVGPPTTSNKYCIGNGIQVLQEEANPKLPIGAFTSTQRGTDGLKVDFTISQLWLNDAFISWITPVYRQNGQDFVCSAEFDRREFVVYGTSNTYTAECNAQGIAPVKVYVYDVSFLQSYEANTHGCSSWGNNTGIATYIFDVPCRGQDLCCEAPEVCTPFPTPPPVMPTAAPVVPTTSPVTPSVAPVTPSLAPVTPSLSPVTPSVAPVTPSVAPVTPSVAPVTPSLAPVALSVAPVPTCPHPPCGDCPYLVGDTDSTICPDQDVIVLYGVKSDDNRIVPAGLDPSSIFYDLKFKGNSSSPEVSFKIDNPFDFAVDMLIQYHFHPKGSTKGGLDTNCTSRLNEPGCVPQSPSITAGCLNIGGGVTAGAGVVPFAMVSVIFISDNPSLGSGGTDVEPYECCPIPTGDLTKPMVEYTFKILCACPTTSRKLRRGVAYGKETTNL